MKSSYKGEVKTVEEVLKSEQFKYANDLLAYRVKHQLTGQINNDYVYLFL